MVIDDEAIMSMGMYFCRTVRVPASESIGLILRAGSSLWDRKKVRENTPGDVLDFVLRNAGIVNGFLSVAQGSSPFCSSLT